MTNQQIDILMKDGDIKPENVGPLLFGFSKYRPVIFGRRVVIVGGGKRFEISDDLEEVLNYIFESFLELSTLFPHGHYKEKIEMIINNNLDSQYQKVFIENEIQKVLKIKQKLVSNYKLAGSIEEIKNNWMDKMALKMEPIIECIKFRIFEGRKIESLINRKRIPNYPLLNQYFLSPPEVEDIIQLVTIEKNIKYLQSRIAFKEVDSLIKSIKSNELSINQIALIHFYKGIQITRLNSKKIAESYGYTSGEKLFQRFTHYSKTSNRTERPTPCTPRKLENKIEFFQSVIPHLNSSKTRANDELTILKSHYNTEYE